MFLLPENRIQTVDMLNLDPVTPIDNLTSKHISRVCLCTTDETTITVTAKKVDSLVIMNTNAIYAEYFIDGVHAGERDLQYFIDALSYHSNIMSQKAHHAIIMLPEMREDVTFEVILRSEAGVDLYVGLCFAGAWESYGTATIESLDKPDDLSLRDRSIGGSPRIVYRGVAEDKQIAVFSKVEQYVAMKNRIKESYLNGRYMIFSTGNPSEGAPMLQKSLVYGLPDYPSEDENLGSRVRYSFTVQEAI